MKLTKSKISDRSKTYRFVTTSIISESFSDYASTIPNLDTPEAGFKFWNEVIAKQASYEADKENLVVVLLNAKLRPYAWHTVPIGYLNETTAHPREILRPCIAGAAYGFVLMHNHPSGDSNPSKADESITRRIVDASTLMQIRLLDHIIIGQINKASLRSPYYSFRESGLIP